MSRPIVAAAAAALAGCTMDVDPAWQLDHDRVIGVRATPPRIASGEAAQIDALIGHKGAPPEQVEPDTAELVSPASLAGALGRSGGHWTITAPGDAGLAAGRRELGLPDGDPVPVRVRVRFTASGLSALKVVWLGQHTDNPVLDPVAIDGKDGRALAAITVAAGVDVPLAVEFDDTFNINWLTSCGTMHDFDLARAHLRVEPDDPHAGTLALVVRDDLGGVAWQLWPITAE
jgi:hypothetical protein